MEPLSADKMIIVCFTETICVDVAVVDILSHMIFDYQPIFVMESGVNEAQHAA